MAGDEFAIIKRHFGDIGQARPDTVLGIGDDAAVVEPRPGYQQVLSLDTLIAGVHFPADTAPADIGYKALAVNLSDLAAMAAEPAWFLLSLTLPDADEAWLEGFATGLADCAADRELQLIGGDTCSGELSVSIQIIGQVPNDRFVGRSDAKSGDRVVVSGRLGDAGLGLAHLQGRIALPSSIADDCIAALNRPRPRLELTPLLRDCASAAIDISDGLQGDLGHILSCSGCGAVIDRAALPVRDFIREQGCYDFALGAGDDYELCFTLPERHLPQIDEWNRQWPHCPLTIIGEITPADFILRSGDDTIDLRNSSGFRHFE